MLNKFFLFFCVFMLVNSCSDPKVRKRFNLDYVAPDEFMVQKQKDLVIPKSFSLAAPQEETKNKTSESENYEKFPQSDKDFLKKVD